MNRIKSLSVFALAIAAASLYGRTVTETAPDGVNTITQEVDDETGLVESSQMTLVHVPEQAGEEAENRKRVKENIAAIVEDVKAEIRKNGTLELEEPKVTVYRLELYSDAEGEQTFVVGCDGVRRPVVLVDPMDYRLLTERFEQVWQSFHSTADGRRKIHGRPMVRIDEKRLERVEEYADGYTHTESLPKKTKRTQPQQERNGAILRLNQPPAPPSNMSKRQWKMRRELQERKKNPIKEITVEHDAATGTDRVIR